MIDFYFKEIDRKWFGLAYVGEAIVSTVVGSNRDSVVRSLVRSIPSDAEYRVVSNGSAFAEEMVLMLNRIECGDEECKHFVLATEHVPEPIAGVLRAAAAIPLGYVASYGNIAKAAGTDARTVGKIMATNPLYPIVPCHRVVGADFSLVGYGGRKNTPALRAKLARLCKETKGFSRPREILVNRSKLTVYPVENVIRKARKLGSTSSGQQRLLVMENW